jgi:hypothetical protein
VCHAIDGSRNFLLALVPTSFLPPLVAAACSVAQHITGNVRACGCGEKKQLPVDK